MLLLGNDNLLPEGKIGGSNLAPIDIDEYEVGPSEERIRNFLSRLGKRSKTESYPASFTRVQKSVRGFLRSLPRAQKFLFHSNPNMISKSPEDKSGFAHGFFYDEEVGHQQRNSMDILCRRDWFEPRNFRLEKRAKTKSYQPGTYICEI